MFAWLTQTTETLNPAGVICLDARGRGQHDEADPLVVTPLPHDPPRGLDDLDQFLLRKGRLMARCGAPRDFLIRRSGPSPALMCATRVLLANETEVGALEGGDGPPAWFAGAGERFRDREAVVERDVGGEGELALRRHRARRIVVVVVERCDRADARQRSVLRLRPAIEAAARVDSCAREAGDAMGGR